MQQKEGAEEPSVATIERAALTLPQKSELVPNTRDASIYLFNMNSAYETHTDSASLSRNMSWRLAYLDQRFNLVQQDGLVAELDQRLGLRECKRSQSCAVTAHENERFELGSGRRHG